MNDKRFNPNTFIDRQFEQVISANHRLMMAIAPSAVQFAATNRRSAA
jgi:hypothetical protein